MLVKRSLLNQAKLLDCNMHQASTKKQVIEIPGGCTKLLLEEQKFNTWLLIRDGNPQILLKTREALRFLQKLKVKRNRAVIS